MDPILMKSALKITYCNVRVNKFCPPAAGFRLYLNNYAPYHFFFYYYSTANNITC